MSISPTVDGVPHEHVPVLIVGGGVAGLTAALLLRQHGVDTLLVEKHADTSPLPKARRFNPRSNEVFRMLGLSDQVSEAARPLAKFTRMLAGPTLAEAGSPPPPAGRQPGTAPDPRALFARYSPSPPILCPQDVLEPVLRQAAQARGAQVRFATELVAFSPYDDHVTVRLQHTSSGESYTVVADYLIAADGAHSRIREALGIPRSGAEHLADNLDICFRADLTDLVRGKEFNICRIENPAASGAFVSVNGTDRWLFSTSDFPVGDRRARDLEDHEWEQLLRTVLGVSDPDSVDIEILSRMPWESGMYVADRFAEGRVFLAGDAAHVMPPMAAAGANTAIADVANLAWKLAAVLGGSASATLLESYHAERHPVGYATAAFSSQVRGHLGTMAKAVTGGGDRPVDMTAGMFGAQYPEGAFVSDGRDPAPWDRYAPGGRPGTRIPHAWLDADGERVSTLDMVGTDFLMLTGPDGEFWQEAAAVVAAAHGIGLRTIQIGEDEAGKAWLAESELTSTGALLVRPDAIVAWHCPAGPARPAESLGSALARVLSR
ncbi:FAD-dependent monooxygenase [Amycolatopsis sp. NPDC049868]|uniref:FAD-dependent monooxygenase n=1 Tax=Amycolatopsis sp. NPDC049868 TaxID=3363934 RepID=UPI0037BDC707